MSLATAILLLTFITLNVFAVIDIKRNFSEESFIEAISQRASWGITVIQVQFAMVIGAAIIFAIALVVQAFAILDGIKLF